MTIKTQNLPLDVVALATPGVQLIGLAGMLEAFDAANRIQAARGRPPIYRLHLRSLSSRTSTACFELATSTAPVRSPHTFVIGGSLDVDPSPEVVAAAGRIASRAERVVSVCVGAFTLGELGWLDGRKCTTHWLAADRLRRTYPLADVTEDAIYVEDESVFTSAGAAAAIDLALHLISLDGGESLSRKVARALVVHHRRSGGQAQFGPALRIPRSRNERIRRLIEELIEDPSQDHRVDVLARRAGMSPRHFARVFRDETQLTPAAFVTGVRVDAAKAMLTSTDVGLDVIAERCGFRRAETLRRAFHKRVGVGPKAYRQSFT